MQQSKGQGRAALYRNRLNLARIAGEWRTGLGEGLHDRGKVPGRKVRAKPMGSTIVVATGRYSRRVLCVVGCLMYFRYFLCLSANIIYVCMAALSVYVLSAEC